MIDRKEKRLLIALIGVVLVGGACYAGVKLYQEHQIQKAEEILKAEQKQVDQTFCIGDTIVLDSEEDEKPLPSGGSYDASLDWEGRMDLTVDRARLYPDLDSVLAELNREEIWTIEFERNARRRMEQFDEYDSYVMLDVTLDNISATSRYASLIGYPWFNISLLSLSCKGHDAEIVCFDGMPAEGDISSDMYWFSLEKGSAATYKVVYAVSQKTKPMDLFAYIGSGYIPNKYHIDLAGIEVIGGE